MTYSELKKELENAPLTWLGGLLLTLVEVACKKHFFVSAEAMKNALNRQVDRSWVKK